MQSMPTLRKPTVKRHSQNGWEFEFSQGIMMPSKMVDEVEETLELQFIPEVIYNDTYAKLSCPGKDFCYYINPVDDLRFCHYKKRESSYSVDYKDSTNLDVVNVLPTDLQVKEAKFWKDRRGMDEIDGKKIEMLEKISDWTHTSPYKGHARMLSMLPDLHDFKDHAQTLTEKLEAIKSETDDSPITISTTEEKIPVEKLGRDNPILWHSHLFLFEDDLDDSGRTQAQFKFRVMKDCWFGLVRYFLRVDEICLRLCETRVYHEFGTDHILRQFDFKEMSYQELQKARIRLDSQFNIHPQQADLASQFTKVKFTLNDIIKFTDVKQKQEVEQKQQKVEQPVEEEKKQEEDVFAQNQDSVFTKVQSQSEQQQQPQESKEEETKVDDN